MHGPSTQMGMALVSWVTPAWQVLGQLLGLAPMVSTGCAIPANRNACLWAEKSLQEPAVHGPGGLAYFHAQQRPQADEFVHLRGTPSRTRRSGPNVLTLTHTLEG